jgi:2-polyprenyl-3-methyl-5-hydroxy-6-metoxy-1,4-benzoquinol methylase
VSAPATRTLERCAACGGGPPFRPLALRYEWQGASFPLVACRDCGMRFLRVQPAGETLERMYSAEYFRTDFRCGRSDTHSFDDAAFRAENAGLLDRFEAYRGAGRLLEVGCASGGLLRQAAERGWSATGVELSADAVAHARSLGVAVHQGALADAPLAEGAFDLVFMGDVLEHVPDCRADAARVAQLLAPGGHFFLRGPITTNSLARRLAMALYGMAGRAIVLREPPYHLWEFTPRPLATLMKAVGLEVVVAEQAKIPPGRPHGSKSAAQAAAMAALDALNLPITRACNALGDRVVMVARKPGR